MLRTRLAAALGLLLVFALTGCSDDEPSGQATLTPAATSVAVASPSPTPVPTPPPATPESTPRRGPPEPVSEISAAFRDFVRDEVSPALREMDVTFFAQRAKTEPVVCTADNTPSLPGGPACQTVGEGFDGFALGGYRSELHVAPLTDAMALIERLFAEEAPSASDEFGGSSPGVHVIGVPNASWEVDGGATRLADGPNYATIVSAIIERPDDLTMAGLKHDPLRVALILNWTPAGDGFELLSMLSAISTGEGLLESGESLWTVWERFEP